MGKHVVIRPEDREGERVYKAVTPKQWAMLHLWGITPETDGAWLLYAYQAFPLIALLQYVPKPYYVPPSSAQLALMRDIGFEGQLPDTARLAGLRIKAHAKGTPLDHWVFHLKYQTARDLQSQLRALNPAWVPPALEVEVGDA